MAQRLGLAQMVKGESNVDHDAVLLCLHAGPSGAGYRHADIGLGDHSVQGVGWTTGTWLVGRCYRCLVRTILIATRTQPDLDIGAQLPVSSTPCLCLQ